MTQPGDAELTNEAGNPKDRSPPATSTGQTKSEKDELDDELTEALEETLPASDPMSSLRSD